MRGSRDDCNAQGGWHASQEQWGAPWSQPWCNGEMVACLGTWGSELEAVTQEALGSKTRQGEGPAL